MLAISSPAFTEPNAPKREQSEVPVAASSRQPQKSTSDAPAAMPEQVKQLLEAQDKRLSDIWSTVNLLSYIAALLGILTTTIVVFFSLKSTSAAVAEAKNEARKSTEEWMRQNGEKLLAEESKKVLAPQVESALKDIKSAATPILVALDAELQKTVKLNEGLGARNNVASATDADEGIAQDAAQSPLGQADPSNATQQTSNRASKSDRDEYRVAVALARNGQYAESIARFEAIMEKLEGALDEVQQSIYLDSALELSRLLRKVDSTSKAMALYEEVLKKFGDIRSSRAAGTLIRIIAEFAVQLQKQRDFQRCIDVCDFGLGVWDNTRPGSVLVTQRLGTICNTKGKCFFELGRYDESIQMHDELVRRLSTHKVTQTSLSSIATSIIRVAQCLIKLNRTDEAKALLRNAITELLQTHAGTGTLAANREMFALANIFEEEKNYPEALALYSSIIATLDPNDRYSLSPLVLQALLRKAEILSRLGLVKEEIAVYDEVVSLWEKYTEVKQFNEVYAAAAYVNKAIVLSKLGQSGDALAATTEVVDLFKASDDPAIIEQVTKAIKLKALLER